MGSNNSTPTYNLRKINVKSRSAPENGEMPENFTMYAGKSPRKKKFVTHLDEYPKFIKLVKSPLHERRRDAFQESLPPNLIPQQISHPPNVSYRVIQQQPITRHSNQHSSNVAYIDWAPQNRIPNYNLYPNHDYRNNLYKSYSYDGYTQNLAHIPLARRNNQYIASSAPHGYLANDQNFYSRNTHGDRGVLVGNRGVHNSTRNSGPPHQERSADTSQQSAASSRRSTDISSEFYYPREMDVETVDRFRDADGRLIRLVKPIGSSTRIFNKTNAPQMFMIVDHPNEYITQSDPGRFVIDERDELMTRIRSNRSEEIRNRRRINSNEEIRSGRSFNSEENISSRSFNSEENIGRRSNQNDQKEEIFEDVRPQEKKEKIAKQVEKEKEIPTEEDERKEKILTEETKEEISKEEKEERKEEIPKEDRKEEMPEEEEEEERKEEMPIEDRKDEKPKEKKENSSKSRKETPKKKKEKEHKIETLKSKEERSETKFKRDRNISYKDKIAMAQEVDVS